MIDLYWLRSGNYGEEERERKIFAAVHGMAFKRMEKGLLYKDSF